MMYNTMESHLPLATLYTTKACIEGHACRIIINEKEFLCNVEFVDDNAEPQQVLDYWNPYGESPILLDRDFALYGSHIIAEYLDDRVRQPPLMPSDSAVRSQARLLIHRFQLDWIDKLKVFEKRKHKPNRNLRERILQEVIGYWQEYNCGGEFLMGEEYSLVDCFYVAVLCHLRKIDVEIPKEAWKLKAYLERMEERDAFKKTREHLEPNLYIKSLKQPSSYV